MSDFRVYLLAIVLIAAVYRVWSRRRKTESGDPSVATETAPKCPHCEAEIEPGFLECWNCRRKFKDSAPSPDDSVTS